MPREQRVTMPDGKRYTKNTLREIYRRMGEDVWKEFSSYRDNLKFTGMSANDSWAGAITRYPMDPIARRAHFQAMYKDSKGKERKKLYLARKQTLIDHTPVPLLNWAYANMHIPRGKEKPPASGRGDQEFLDFCRANKKEFYIGFFKPAMLKKYRVSDDEAPPDVPAPLSEKTKPTKELLNVLEEAEKAPPPAPVPEPEADQEVEDS